MSGPTVAIFPSRAAAPEPIGNSVQHQDGRHGKTESKSRLTKDLQQPASDKWARSGKVVAGRRIKRLNASAVSDLNLVSDGRMSRENQTRR